MLLDTDTLWKKYLYRYSIQIFLRYLFVHLLLVVSVMEIFEILF